MAVKAGQRRPWRSLLQRGVDTAGDLADLVAQKISVAIDPRARLLRRRRRALRWGLVFTAGCLLWGLVTALLAAWGWFTSLLVITGTIAVTQAIPATLLLLRYRWLRSEPLPVRRPASVRRLPPPGSAARPAMSALGASERGFFSLLGVMERGAMLTADEIRDLTAAANQTSAAMVATAAEVVSMERAVQCSAASRSYLVPTINAFTAQLSTGGRGLPCSECPLYLENAAGPEPDTKRAEGRRFGAFGGGDLRWMADRVPRQGSGRRGLGSRSGAGVPQGADARGWRHTADGVPRVGQPAIRRGVPGFWCWLDHVLTGFGGRNAICAIEDGVEPRVAWWALCTDFDVPRSMGRRTPGG